MKRGRPRDEYPDGEFRGIVLQELTRRSLSLRVLELLSGVNRGTLSAVLNGRRPCERRQRLAILNALGLDEAENAHFLPARTNGLEKHYGALFDGRRASHPSIQRAQALMASALYHDAHNQLRQIFESATTEKDVLLQAEAAGYIGWFHGELERFDDARRWLLHSIHLIESDLQMRAGDIVQSIGSSTLVTEVSNRKIEVLARALRIYGKVLTVRIVHDLDYARVPEAKRVFQHSTELDERLRLPELPHTLRWQAVAMSAEDTSTLQNIDTLLSRSRELMPAGSPGEASLIREQGIVRWQKGRLSKSEDFLLDAKERLARFADARALGAAFCTLSKVTLQAGGSPRQAQRYALLALSLHPYGYVLRHGVDQVRTIPIDDRARTIAAVTAGEGPFEAVHAVLANVATASTLSAGDLLKQNLARVQRTIHIGQ